MKKLNILNVYQLNIIQTATFMLKVKLNLAPNVFSETFNEIKHKYPTNYSANNFLIPQKQLKVSEFSISVRGPKIWNNFLKGSPSAEPSLCFLKDIITKFCFINSILTKDVSIESFLRVYSRH